MARGLVFAIVSAIIAFVAGWLGCWLWDEIAAEVKGDFPNGILCVLTWILVVLAWFAANFGVPGRRV